MSLISGAPSKDYDYVNWRYLKHPIFKYVLYGIKDDHGSKVAVIVTREEEYFLRKICKIIDFYGDSGILGRITTAIDTLNKEKGYEFTDIYSFGVPCEIYESAGFVKCDNNSKNIIPALFQPYVQINHEIALVSSGIAGERMFRGDGAIDRPRFAE